MGIRDRAKRHFRSPKISVPCKYKCDNNAMYLCYHQNHMAEVVYHLNFHRAFTRLRRMSFYRTHVRLVTKISVYYMGHWLYVLLDNRRPI